MGSYGWESLGQEDETRKEIKMKWKGIQVGSTTKTKGHLSGCTET